MTRRSISCRCGRMPAAFSLVEVLISVMVLALGMLGLGTVIPVVVREQRIANEIVNGIVVQRSAEAYLRRRVPTEAWRLWLRGKDLDRDENLDWNHSTWGEYALTSERVDPVKTQDPLERHSEWRYPWMKVPRDDDFPIEGEVQIPLFDPDPSAPAGKVMDPGESLSIPVAQRLFPSPFGGGATAQTRREPRFVWDFLARRMVEPAVVRNGNSLEIEPMPTSRIQIVVFVRKIDTGLRVRDGKRLSNLLTGVDRNKNAMVNDRRVAVGIETRGTDQGSPARATTENQFVEYSQPLILAIWDNGGFDDADSDKNLHRDRLVLRRQTTLPTVLQPPDATVKMVWEDAAALAAQPGQKLVDSLGNIYTVIGSEADGSDIVVKIDPPVPSGVKSSREVWAVAFTPQIPIAVSVFEIEP